jgi:hypothetical protein
MSTTTGLVATKTLAELDHDGRVLVLLAGSDAAAAASEYAEQGYRIVDLHD